VKRVRFNDAVQVFLLPPKGAESAGSAVTAAGAAAEDGPGLDPDFSGKQQQQQQEHGQWVRSSSAAPLSRRKAAALRREQAAAAAAAAAAAVAAITGEAAADADGSNATPSTAAAAAGAATPGTGQDGAMNPVANPLASNISNGANGSAGGSKRPGRKSNTKRRPASEYLGQTSSKASALGLSAAAAAAGSEVEWDDDQGLADAVELEAGFSPWHKQSIQVGKPLVKGSAEAAKVHHMLLGEVGPALLQHAPLHVLVRCALMCNVRLHVLCWATGVMPSRASCYIVWEGGCVGSTLHFR
jgi:hypothetical protein